MMHTTQTQVKLVSHSTSLDCKMQNTIPAFKIAVNSLRDAVKTAIDDDTFDQGQLYEVWRHYNGMKSILTTLEKEQPKTKSDPHELNFDYGEVINFYDPDYNIQAAQPVDLDNQFLQDVITFS